MFVHPSGKSLANGGKYQSQIYLGCSYVFLIQQC